MEERGILVSSIGSTDPNASRKRLVLLCEWFSLPIVAIVLISLALSSQANGEDYWYVFLVVLLALIPLEIVTMLFVANQFHAYTEPIDIYSNGVEAYPSVFNKIRGVEGFMEKSNLVGIELRDISVSQQGRRDYDRSITLELSNGKRRVIGIRTRDVATEAARTMSLLWMLPIEDVPVRQRRRY